MRGLSGTQGLPRFKKFSDSSIFEEVFPSKRTKMFFGKIRTYTCIQALKFCMQALFFMQIKNLKSDFRFSDFLLFLGIKSETNQWINLEILLKILNISLLDTVNETFHAELKRFLFLVRLRLGSTRP